MSDRTRITALAAGILAIPLVSAVLLVSGCVVPKPIAVVPKPPAVVDRTAELTKTCHDIWVAELAREIPAEQLANCVRQAQPPQAGIGLTGEQWKAILDASPEYVARQAQLEALRKRPRETGNLHTLGRGIVDDAGVAWRWKGFSTFLIAKQFCEGEDVEARIEEPIALGFNVLRIFASNASLTGEPFALTPTCVRRFVDHVGNDHGARVEVTVFTDAQRVKPTLAEQRAYVAEMAAAIEGSWAAIGELVNEWPQNGVDPGLFARPPPGTVLWSRGSNVGDGAPFSPPWDFVTDHPARDDQWPRKVGCRDVEDALNVPCVEDEPIGADEREQPGRRSATPDDFRFFGGICGLHASGCTFHSQAGLASQPLGPVQTASAKAFLEGINFAPAAASTWPYQRGCAEGGGCIGNMPIDHRDLPDPIGSLRTFCRPRDGAEWCVAVRPAPDWAVVPLRGCQVVEQPFRGFVRLAC